MGLLENDVIFAYLNRADKHHPVARQIFHLLRNGQLAVQVSSVTLVEMALIYRSEQRESQLLTDLATLTALPGTEYWPLTPEDAVRSAFLRQSHRLSFFDSHYAATALNHGVELISFDEAYDHVPELRRIDPTSLVRRR